MTLRYISMKDSLPLREAQGTMQFICFSFGFCENDDASLSTSVNGDQVFNVLIEIPSILIDEDAEVLDCDRSFDLVSFNQVNDHSIFGHVFIG